MLTWCQLDVDAVLHYEPPAVHCPFCVWVAEFHVVVHEEGWDQFGPKTVVSICYLVRNEANYISSQDMLPIQVD